MLTSAGERIAGKPEYSAVLFFVESWYWSLNFGGNETEMPVLFLKGGNVSSKSGEAKLVTFVITNRASAA